MMRMMIYMVPCVTHLKCFCLTGKVSVACDVSSPETGDLVT